MNEVEFDVNLEDPDFVEALEDGEAAAITTMYLGVDGTPLMGTDPDARRKEFIIPYLDLLLESILSAGKELVAPFRYGPGQLKAEQFDRDTIILSVTDMGEPQNQDLDDGVEAGKDDFVEEVLEESRELIHTVETVNPDLMEQADVLDVREHIRELEEAGEL